MNIWRQHSNLIIPIRRMAWRIGVGVNVHWSFGLSPVTCWRRSDVLYCVVRRWMPNERSRLICHSTARRAADSCVQRVQESQSSKHTEARGWREKALLIRLRTSGLALGLRLEFP